MDSIRLDRPRVPLTNELWERQPEIQELRDFARDHGSLTSAMEPTEPCPIEQDRPEFLPPARAIVAGQEGRLWVEAPTADGFRLVVFDAEGELLGETAMPDRDPDAAPDVRGDRLYLVTIDDLDVQSIEVYQARFGP